MSNPFEDENGVYVVLTNDEGQCSLWPTSIQVPAGWTTVYGPSKRSECIDFVEGYWTDMRPRSLASSTEQPTSGRSEAVGR